MNFRTLRIFSLFFSILSFSDLLFAQQSVGIDFARSIGNQNYFGGNVRVNSIKTDASGNTYVGGYFSSYADFDPGAGTQIIRSSGDIDAFFGKYDASGNLVFVKTFGSSTTQDLIFDLELDASGNIIVGGYFANSNADFDPGAGVIRITNKGGRDAFFAKYDANGNYVFVKSVGSSGADELTDLILDASNNIFITGYFSGTADFDPGAGTRNLTNTGGNDIYFAKYNSSGVYQFAKSMGGNANDFGTGLALDASGNIYITGYFSSTSTSDFDPGSGTLSLTSAGTFDIFFGKFNSSGEIVFVRKIGSTADDFAYGITVDGSDNFYVVGSFSGSNVNFNPGGTASNLTSADGTDAFLMKYNSSGVFQFVRGFGGTNNQTARQVRIDGSSNLWITGDFLGASVDFDPGAGSTLKSSSGQEDVFISKFSLSGTFSSVVTIGGSSNDLGLCISSDANGNVLVGGYFKGTVDFDPGSGTDSRNGNGIECGFFLSLNSTGTYRFAGHLGSFNNFYLAEEIRDLKVDANGNTYVAGSFSETVDFDPGPGETTITAAGGTDIFFAKYNASGSLVFANALRGPSTDNAYGIALDPSGNIYVTGIFQGTVDFDPGSGTLNKTAAGSGNDLFFAKYDASGNLIYAHNLGSSDTETGFSITADASGNAYLTGYFKGTVDFDPASGTTANLTSAGFFDMFFAKYNASGNYVFAKSIGSSTGDDGGRCISLDANGNIYISGYISGTADVDPNAGVTNLTSAGNSDIFFAKYTSTGALSYARAVGSTGADMAYQHQLDASGNIYIVGIYAGTTDFDPSGTGTLNLTNLGGNDGFLAKYNATGDFVFANSIGGIGHDYVYGISLSADNYIFISGGFRNTVDFNPSSSVTNSLTATGSAWDIFFAKYDNSGNYVYAKKTGDASDDVAYSIGLHGNDNVIIGGFFASKVDFDLSSGELYLTSNNGNDAFIARYTECSQTSIPAVSVTGEAGTISGSTNLSDGACRVLATVAPSGAQPVSGSVSARIWVESSVGLNGALPFVAKHYEITPASNPTTATGRVTLYFSQQDFDDFNSHPNSVLNLPSGPSDATGIANLLVLKYSGTSANETGLPESYSSSEVVINPVDSDIIWNATLSRWEVSFSVTGFSGFFIQTAATSLPVTFGKFNVKKIAQKSLLDWVTQSEQLNKGFQIERSKDGIKYYPIGFVQAIGNGNSTVMNRYQFIDEYPVIGRNYYRLQQQDLDGKTSYSEVREITFSALQQLVYPNPVGQTVYIRFSDAPVQSCNILLQDITGRTLRQWELAKPRSTIELPLNDIRPGLYHLKIQYDNQLSIHKIVKH